MAQTSGEKGLSQVQVDVEDEEGNGTMPLQAFPVLLGPGWNMLSDKSPLSPNVL